MTQWRMHLYFCVLFTNAHCSSPNLLAVSQPSPALACFPVRPKLRRLINNRKNHGTITFLGLRKTFKDYSLNPLLM